MLSHKPEIKMIIAVAVTLAALIISIGAGSVYIPPGDIIATVLSHILDTPPPVHIDEMSANIIWRLRLPRALLAFFVGGALATSGAVMQSVLKNPLASSYTLGVSAGAGLGVGVIIITGMTLPFIGIFTLPLTGFVCGILTVIIAIGFASRIDSSMENNTIILAGMVFSLFINALLTLIAAMSKEYMQQIIYWQMGSFSMKDWSHVWIMAPITLAGTLLAMRFSRELDILTFGEEQAQAIGVELKRTKWQLLTLSAGLTGCAISLAGVVGFVDLIAPHVVRRFFGASHKYVVPASALFGGAFMVLADLAARTVTAPGELPVGAVTALVGAPFFAYIYFVRRRG